MWCDHNQGEWVLRDKPHWDLGRGQAWGQGLGSCLLQSLIRGHSWEIYQTHLLPESMWSK